MRCTGEAYLVVVLMCQEIIKNPKFQILNSKITNFQTLNSTSKDNNLLCICIGCLWLLSCLWYTIPFSSYCKDSLVTLQVLPLHAIEAPAGSQGDEHAGHDMSSMQMSNDPCFAYNTSCHDCSMAGCNYCQKVQGMHLLLNTSTPTNYCNTYNTHTHSLIITHKYYKQVSFILLIHLLTSFVFVPPGFPFCTSAKNSTAAGCAMPGCSSDTFVSSSLISPFILTTHFLSFSSQITKLAWCNSM